MKKTLLFFCALLMLGISGVWATTKTFTVTYAKGNSYGIYYDASGNASSGWVAKWMSGGNDCNQLPNVAITSNGNTISGYNGYFLNGSYTISVPAGMVITGYSMQAKSYEEGLTDTEKYITPAGESAVELNTSSATPITVTGLSSNTATFTITGTENGNSRVIFTSFSISVQGEALTSLASANSSKRYYLISRRGFLSTNTNTTALANLGCVVKGLNYVATPLIIVTEAENIYLKTIEGKYVTSAGTLANAASGVFASDDSGVADFPFKLKIGSNYFNSGTGGASGIVWNTYSTPDAGNCYAIIEAPSEETLNYSFTDTNGANYGGTYTGFNGVTIPQLTGCYGYTISSSSWNLGTKTLSAIVNFPFAISSNGVTNYTYIAMYSKAFCWYVKSSTATDINVKENSAPTNESGENEKYKWAIIPSFSAGKFSFTIKNASTGTYITSTATDPGTSVNSSHPQGKVTLSASGTPLEYTSYPSWYIPSTDRYLSINTVSKSVEQYLGIYTGNHYGTTAAFYAPADFDALNTTLVSLCAATSGHAFGNGYGKYNAENASEITTALDELKVKSIFTEAEYNAYITLLSDIHINVPAAKSFIRIKGHHTSKYAKAGLYTVANVDEKSDPDAKIPNSTGTETDGSDIWYYDDAKHLINYKNGLGTVATRAFAALSKTKETTTFSESTCSAGSAVKIGVYEIKSNYSGSKIWYSNTSNVDRNSSNNALACEWDLEEVTSLPVTITAANYATLYSPVALTIPSGVTAYTATISGDKLVLTPVSTTIPKNTGVLLYSATPDTYNFDITDDVDAIDGNAFSGTIATINRSKTEEVYNSYILSGGSNGIGFYRDGSTTLKGFKAFVDATPSGDVKQFLQFDFGNADAIQTISNALQSEDREIYNLAGQRLNSLQRGVNIVNGKKVLVK